MIDELSLQGRDVAYVTGRVRPDKSKGEKPEINGKSNNLNNVLCNHIYRDVDDHTIIPNSECIVVFDADMCPNPNFYVKVSAHPWPARSHLAACPPSLSQPQPAHRWLVRVLPAMHGHAPVLSECTVLAVHLSCTAFQRSRAPDPVDPVRRPAH